MAVWEHQEEPSQHVQGECQCFSPASLGPTYGATPPWPSQKMAPSPSLTLPWSWKEGALSWWKQKERRRHPDPAWQRPIKQQRTHHSGPQQGFPDSKNVAILTPSPHHTAGGQHTVSGEAIEEQAIQSSLQGRYPQSSESHPALRAQG